MITVDTLENIRTKFNNGQRKKRYYVQLFQGDSLQLNWLYCCNVYVLNFNWPYSIAVPVCRSEEKAIPAQNVDKPSEQNKAAAVGQEQQVS